MPIVDIKVFDQNSKMFKVTIKIKFYCNRYYGCRDLSYLMNLLLYFSCN